MDKFQFWFVFLSAMLLFLIIGIGLGVRKTHYEAVKADVAEWVVVDAHGTTRFQWKTK